MPILQDAASLRAHRGGRASSSPTRCWTNPAVGRSDALSGMDPLTFTLRTNTGIIWVPLKDWDERKSDGPCPPRAVAGSVFGAGAQDQGCVRPRVRAAADRRLGMTGGFEATSSRAAAARSRSSKASLQKFVAAAAKRKELANVTTTFTASVPQMRIDLDREKAKMLGVKVGEVFETLQSTFGALYVNDFNRSGRVYQVQLQSEPQFRAHPDDIRNVYVRRDAASWCR